MSNSTAHFWELSHILMRTEAVSTSQTTVKVYDLHKVQGFSDTILAIIVCTHSVLPPLLAQLGMIYLIYVISIDLVPEIK